MYFPVAEICEIYLIFVIMPQMYFPADGILIIILVTKISGRRQNSCEIEL